VEKEKKVRKYIRKKAESKKQEREEERIKEKEEGGCGCGWIACEKAETRLPIDTRMT